VTTEIALIDPKMSVCRAQAFREALRLLFPFLRVDEWGFFTNVTLQPNYSGPRICSSPMSG